MSKQKVMKGTFADLKTDLRNLKHEMQANENQPSKRVDMYEAQEHDIKAIQRHGQSNNE